MLRKKWTFTKGRMFAVKKVAPNEELTKRVPKKLITLYAKSIGTEGTLPRSKSKEEKGYCRGSMDPAGSPWKGGKIQHYENSC